MSPEQVRALLASRKVLCSEGCRGWVIDHGPDLTVQRCDECASLNSYDALLSDPDVAQLSEAQDDRRAVEASIETEWETLS